MPKKHLLYQNMSLEKQREAIEEFQRTEDTEVIFPLYMVYNHLIFRCIYVARKKNRWLRNVELEELYNSAVVGFQQAILNCKKKFRTNVLGRYFKTRIIRHLEHSFNHRRKVDDSTFVGEGSKSVYFDARRGGIIISNNPSTNQDTFVEHDANVIFDCPVLSPRERWILIHRHRHGLLLREMAKMMNTQSPSILHTYKSAIRKVKEYLGVQDIPN